jgi:hypothetical protein
VNVRKETFEVVTDAGQVVIDRFWIDVVAHEDCEKVQCFGGGINRTMMKMAECEVRVGGGIVSGFGRMVNRMAESNSTLPNKMLVCPRLSNGLPGLSRFKIHDENSPNASRGGVKRDGICNYVEFTGYMRDTDVERRAEASVNGGD